MATKRSEMVTYEFSAGGSVVGRATWLGPGMVELDFADKKLRTRFASWLGEPQALHGLLFETGAEQIHFWPDENRSRFAEACMSLAHLYKVRRVR